MKAHGAKAYLVNTGWNGTGKRISLKDTRAIIDAIIDGTIEEAPKAVVPIMNLEIPTTLPQVSSGILDPRQTYAQAEEWKPKPKIWPPDISKTSNSIAIPKKEEDWLPQGLRSNIPP